MAETGGVRERSSASGSELSRRGAGEPWAEIPWRLSLDTARESTLDMVGTSAISSEPTGEKVKGDGGVGGRGVVLTDIAKCREIS